MSTSRSALALLREEPTLVGVVIYLFSEGLLGAAKDSAIPLETFARFAAADPHDVLASPDLWPRVQEKGGRIVVTRRAIAEWLRRLQSDRSDFAPAVPRALPGGRA